MALPSGLFSSVVWPVEQIRPYSSPSNLNESRAAPQTKEPMVLIDTSLFGIVNLSSIITPPTKHAISDSFRMKVQTNGISKVLSQIQLIPIRSKHGHFQFSTQRNGEKVIALCGQEALQRKELAGAFLPHVAGHAEMIIATIMRRIQPSTPV